MDSSAPAGAAEAQASSDSEAGRQRSTSKGRRRPSRAGTRSVSTLSAIQLERKRANDREAQRAIRQRNREYIDNLEKRIKELSSTDDKSLQLNVALSRIKELEDEVSQLNSRLDRVTEVGGKPQSSEPSIARRLRIEALTLPVASIESLGTSSSAESQTHFPRTAHPSATPPNQQHSPIPDMDSWQGTPAFFPHQSQEESSSAAPLLPPDQSTWTAQLQSAGSADRPGMYNAMAGSLQQSSLDYSYILSMGGPGVPFQQDQSHGGYQPEQQQYTPQPGVAYGISPQQQQQQQQPRRQHPTQRRGSQQMYSSPLLHPPQQQHQVSPQLLGQIQAQVTQAGSLPTTPGYMFHSQPIPIPGQQLQSPLQVHGGQMQQAQSHHPGSATGSPHLHPHPHTHTQYSRE